MFDAIRIERKAKDMVVALRGQKVCSRGTMSKLCRIEVKFGGEAYIGNKNVWVKFDSNLDCFAQKLKLRFENWLSVRRVW